MDAKARKTKEVTSNARDGFVRVRGAREHNLKGVDIDLPRDRTLAIRETPEFMRTATILRAALGGTE